jgi:hypothetical protein
MPPSEILINPIARVDLYVERGFDPALTDFPNAAFENGARIAGLEPDANEDEEETSDADEYEAGLARARKAFAQLQRLEIEVRLFIATAMEAVHGEDWMKRQIPQTMLESWQEKRAKALKEGQPERPLIEYADFSDYKQIIENKGNWGSVFRSVFGRQEDVRESFQRLFPLRIATMHARIVTQDDELLLWVETRRLMKAIRNSRR